MRTVPGETWPRKTVASLRTGHRRGAASALRIAAVAEPATHVLHHHVRVQTPTTLTNWAGNVVFSAREVHRPATVAALQRLLASSRRIRALGSGHSFSRVADTDGHLVSVAGLPATVELDSQARQARVSAGMRYGEMARHLHARGFAVHNLGSLPHIGVAGACATGTHGSGDRNGILATAVSAVEMVTASGDLLTVRRGDDDFDGSVVALGCLGVVTALTMDVQPAFKVRQDVYDNLSFERLVTDFGSVVSAGYSVSMFLSWDGPGVDMVWVKRRMDDPQDGELPPPWEGARPAGGERHPVPGMPVENCTPQLGVAGPWHERLPHFRLEFTPSSGRELQSEYLVGRQDAVAAIQALRPLGERIAAVVQVSEIRTMAADNLWLSPAYRRDTVGLHFTWVDDYPAVRPVLADVEAALAPFGARPHWGKVFTTAPEVVTGSFPRAAEFMELRERMDPSGTFDNAFTQRYLPR